MNDVMGRIATLRARFEPAALQRTPTTSASSSQSTATGTTDFAALLAAASGVASGTGATQSSASLSATAGANALGLDSTSLATLTRMLSGISGSTASAAATPTSPSTGSLPAGYDQYADAIRAVATEEGVPASLLGAIVWSESSFNPNAVSSAGAKGLAQLMPGTAAGLGVNIDDPMDNLRGGARYLRQMLDRFDSVDEALAAYNAGPGAVQRYGGVPPYSETQNYVTKVLARAATLTGADA